MSKISSLDLNALKAKLQSHFPGAKIEPEGDHVHIGFNPNTSPEFVRQSMIDLQRNNLDLQEARAGGGGGNNTFVDSSNKNFVEGRRDVYHFGDGAIDPNLRVFDAHGKFIGQYS